MSVPEWVYQAHRVGDSVEVIYLPGNPAVHFAPGLAERPRPRWLVWGAIAILGGVAALADSQRRRHKKLTAHGTATRGVVGALSRRGTRRVFSVNYSVRDEERTLRASERNPGRQEGDIETVLYLPGKPQALLYCTSLYRALARGARPASVSRATLC